MKIAVLGFQDMYPELQVSRFAGKIVRSLPTKLHRKLPVALLVLFCGSMNLFAGKHPVPLAKDIDAAKCLECHENKTAEKSIHTAVKEGCYSCHEVRVRGDVTRVNLITSTTITLCLKCHVDKKAGPGQGLLHPPVGRDCTTCHDPHDSPNKDHLRQSLAGDRKENLCLKCHLNGVRISETGSRHAPLDMGCDTCHVIHKKGTIGNPESNLHLSADPHTLCAGCHDVKNESLIKAHQGQPFEKADCLACHAVHQSDGPKLIQRFAHRPYADKSCNACHQAPKDGKVVLTKSDAKELCVQCHAKTVSAIQSAKVQHAGAQGECVDCHDAHASRRPGLVSPDPVRACTKCHAEQAKLQSTKMVLHKAAFRDGCATCHEPHGGTRPKLLRADTNDLCLSCHGTDIKPQKVAGQAIITIFDGAVRLPENYFDSVPKITLRWGLGHPIDKHPVASFADPLDPKKERKLSCLSCHQAHAGNAKAMLISDQPQSLSFCSLCHK
jgi:predicted CXXCH cytochrome family protein